MGRKQAIRIKRRKSRVATISVVAMVIVGALILVAIFQNSGAGGGQYSSFIGKPVSTALLSQVTGVSNSTLAAVGVPPSVRPPATISGNPLVADGKPEVLYIGGEFCPFCAVERWSLIVALSHFGTFSGLEYMQSSSTDVNANTPTFTFANANFSSRYISFVAVEEFDREDQVVRPLTQNESSLVTQFGTCAATGESGGIPFVDIANHYVVNCGAQFSMPQIAGYNWTQVSSQLDNPKSMIAQGMDGAANTLITAICNVDGDQPAATCGQTFAQTLALVVPASGAAASVVNLVVTPEEISSWRG